MEDEYQTDEGSEPLPRDSISIDDFISFVHGWTDSLNSPLWRYFGELSHPLCLEKDLRKRFAIWSAMMERKAGTRKFRLIAGTERSRGGFDIHVFIGGVDCDEQFERTWRAKWIELGGTRADLQQFHPAFVRRYLEVFRDNQHCEPFTLTVKLRHDSRRR